MPSFQVSSGHSGKRAGMPSTAFRKFFQIPLPRHSWNSSGRELIRRPAEPTVKDPENRRTPGLRTAPVLHLVRRSVADVRIDSGFNQVAVYGTDNFPL